MWDLAGTLLGLHNRIQGVAKIKAALKKDERPVRLGILGAAYINEVAIFDPVDTHPSVVIVAIAARDIKRAQEQITKYNQGAAKAYGSYEELLKDDSVDVVYIPLPNGLHCEWSVRAMEAGKHVLCEKPLASNAQEAAKIRQTAEATGKICLEAFHWRFHPAAQKVRSLVESGDYGMVQKISTNFALPRGMASPDDIRFRYDLAGGSCMDLIYVFSCVTFFAPWEADSSTFTIHKAEPILNPNDAKVDDGMTTSFTIDTPGKPPVEGHTFSCLSNPPALGFVPKLWGLNASLLIELEKANIEFPGYVGPWLNHSITITAKDRQGNPSGKKTQLSSYVPEDGRPGERFWTTYRYQLEAFLQAIQDKEAGKEYQGPWVSLAESEKLMSLVDAVYNKAGLPRRGT